MDTAKYVEEEVEAPNIMEGGLMKIGLSRDYDLIVVRKGGFQPW